MKGMTMLGTQTTGRGRIRVILFVALGLLTTALVVWAGTGLSRKLIAERQAELVAELRSNVADSPAFLVERLFDMQLESIQVFVPGMTKPVSFPVGLFSFAPKAFPESFVNGLVYEVEHGSPVYHLKLREVKATREIEVLNADGKVFYVFKPRADYDPHWLVRRLHPEIYLADCTPQKRAEAEEWLDPSHVEMTIDLIPDSYVDVYAEDAVASLWDALLAQDPVKGSAAASPTLTKAPVPGGMMTAMMRSPAADSNILVTGIGQVSTGMLLQVDYPDTQTNRLEMMVCTNLVEWRWWLVETNLVTAGTNSLMWVDTGATNGAGIARRFYRVGASEDSDGDGLADGREALIYHTDPFALDSDGDGLVDGYSGVITTNAYPGGVATNGNLYVEGELSWGTDPAKFDTDGDGMGDGWEVAHGHNPLDPNDPPNVSGTLFYSGRQTGTVWVIAVTSSNSWSTGHSYTSSASGFPVSYLIPDLEQTNYWIKSWVDSIGNGQTNATEAQGVLTNALTIITNRVTGQDITLADPDADSDSLPDWWEVRYFGSTTNTTGSADPDGDEYTNQEEYEADTIPTDVSSHPWNLSGTITYIGPQTGTIYVVACTNAETWAWVKVDVLTNSMAYAITHLPPNANYWVRAWRDSNLDGQPTSWEAWGSHNSNPVFLDGNLTGQDITLADPDVDGDGIADYWEIRYGLDPTYGGGADGAAWWKLDEGSGTNAFDATANGNHGVLMNGSNAWVGGIISNGLSLNGANTYVEVPDSTSLKPYAVSVGMWIKPSQLYTNGTAMFLSKRVPGGTTGYSLGYENGGLSFTICAAGARTLRYPCALTAAVPVHVAGTYSTGDQQLYINGVFVAASNYVFGMEVGSLENGTNSLRLGAASGGTVTNLFAGLLDDVRVDSTPWTSNQVHAIWEIGADPDQDGLSNTEEYKNGTNPTNRDSDADGMFDGWEVKYGLNPASSNDASQDADSDGVNNLSEFIHGSNPNLADTDGDGLGDAEEATAGTNPNNPDTDGDGLTDYAEIHTYFGYVDPLIADTDHDGLNDYVEIVTYNTHAAPNGSGAQDTDKDGLSDSNEVARGTNPLLVDSDGDGIDDKYEVDKGWDPCSAVTATQNQDGDAFNNLTEYLWDYEPTTSNSTPPTSQKLILCPPGSNAVQHSDWDLLAVGDLGANSARIRVRPFYQGGALAEQRLYHTQSPGFYINGIAASSVASPINIPASTTAIEYRVTCDAGALGTNLYFRLTTTNEPTATKDSARCYYPEITQVNFWGPGSANYVDVSRGQTNTLWIGMPGNTNDCRVRMEEVQGPSHWYGIGYFDWTDWMLVKVTGTGADPTNATLNALDWRSAYGVWYNDIATRGIRLDPGSYTFEVGYDMNGNGTLESTEVQETCKVNVLNVKITEPDGLPVQTVVSGDSRFRINPSCFEWQFVHISNEVVTYYATQPIEGLIAPTSSASYNWSVNAGTLNNATTETPTYMPSNMPVPATMTTVSLQLRPFFGSDVFKQERTLEVYRDHLERDYQNWGTGIECGSVSNLYYWMYSRYGQNWKMLHSWNCFGSVWHAFDGTHDGLASDIPVSGFSVSTYDDPIPWATAVANLKRGDIISFYTYDAASGTQVMQHAHTCKGSLSQMYGANNEPAFGTYVRSDGYGHFADWDGGSWKWWITSSETYYNQVNADWQQFYGHPASVKLINRIKVHRRN